MYHQEQLFDHLKHKEGWRSRRSCRVDRERAPALRCVHPLGVPVLPRHMSARGRDEVSRPEPSQDQSRQCGRGNRPPVAGAKGDRRATGGAGGPYHAPLTDAAGPRATGLQDSPRGIVRSGRQPGHRGRRPGPESVVCDEHRLRQMFPEDETMCEDKRPIEDAPTNSRRMQRPASPTG